MEEITNWYIDPNPYLACIAVFCWIISIGGLLIAKEVIILLVFYPATVFFAIISMSYGKLCIEEK